MQKTPEDIKKGLLYCGSGNHCKGYCPYDGRSASIEGCTSRLSRDAYALIQQLEAKNAELLEKVEQMQAERNAAVADLKACVTEAAQGDDFDCCFACKYNNEYGGCDRPNYTIEACGVEDFDNKWTWRGVQQEG